MATPTRWVDLEGGSNVRDLGGLPLRDGGTTVYGRFYRADTPQEWTAADVAAWHRRGLALVVDLRAVVEVDVEGRAPVEGVRWVNTPFVPDEAVMPDEDDPPGLVLTDEDEAIVVDEDIDARVAHYLGYLTGFGRPYLLRAVQALSQAEGPALFHCAAGKDRTGVLAMVLQELAGVERDAVIADYALTTERMPGVFDRLRRLPSYAEGLQDVEYDRLLPTPETMRDLLEAIDSKLGGVRAWLERCGLEPAALDRLAGRLRED